MTTFTARRAPSIFYALPSLPAQLPTSAPPGFAFRKGKLINGRYEVQSKLSAGSYGTILLARDTRAEMDVALKCTRRESSEMSSASDKNANKGESSNLETRLLEKLRKASIHELSKHAGRKHIVRYFDSFHTQALAFAVMEHCNLGDLYEAITTSSLPKDCETIRELVLQLIDAVEFCHLAGVYHRDIKPENIFITASPPNLQSSVNAVKPMVKLGDFGLATTDTWSFEVGTGSDRYQAPEQYDLTNTEGYSPAKADIWALGITILNIVFGRNPWKTPSATDDFIFADFHRDPLSLCDVFPTMSNDLFTVLSLALCIDPSKRDLDLLRNAVVDLHSWTTDEEIMESIFTMDDGEMVLVQQAGSVVPSLSPSLRTPSEMILGQREPLRTPSIVESFRSTSGGDKGRSSSRTKVKSPPRATRKVSELSITEARLGRRPSVILEEDHMEDGDDEAEDEEAKTIMDYFGLRRTGSGPSGRSASRTVGKADKNSRSRYNSFSLDSGIGNSPSNISISQPNPSTKKIRSSTNENSHNISSNNNSSGSNDSGTQPSPCFAPARSLSSNTTNSYQQSDFLRKASASVPVKSTLAKLKLSEERGTHAFSASWSDMLEEEEMTMSASHDLSPSVIVSDEPTGTNSHQKVRTSSDVSSRASFGKDGGDYWDGVAGGWEDDEV